MVKLVDLVKEALKIPSNRNLSGGGGGSGDNEPKRKSKRHRVSGSEEGKDPTLALLDYCLENPSGYDSVWFYLSSELSEKNASKKLQALLIIDSLFHNSPHFRKVVNESMDSLLQHTGILSSSGGSSSRACISHNSVFQKGIELIALWDFLYGTELGKVHILARYIKESLGLQLPNISVQLEELRRQRQERERTHKQKVFLRAQQIRELDLPGLLKTCSETMDTIDQCFNILFPNPLVNEGDENAEGISHCISCQIYLHYCLLNVFFHISTMHSRG
ncbi:hypothetical protein EON65_23775 [archaeon]|nr:MAG: hypothetical protein EON65_23775 [archaeon]